MPNPTHSSTFLFPMLINHPGFRIQMVWGTPSFGGSRIAAVFPPPAEQTDHTFFLSPPSKGIPSFGGAWLALSPFGRSTPHRGVSLLIWLARPRVPLGHHGRSPNQSLTPTTRATRRCRGGFETRPYLWDVCKMSTCSIQQVCIHTSKPSWA